MKATVPTKTPTCAAGFKKRRRYRPASDGDLRQRAPVAIPATELILSGRSPGLRVVASLPVFPAERPVTSLGKAARRLQLRVSSGFPANGAPDSLLASSPANQSGRTLTARKLVQRRCFVKWFPSEFRACRISTGLWIRCKTGKASSRRIDTDWQCDTRCSRHGLPRLFDSEAKREAGAPRRRKCQRCPRNCKQ